MEITTVKAIRKYFDTPPVTVTELKDLSKEDRRELAEMICEDQGWTLAIRE